MSDLARTLIVLGIILVAVGLALLLVPKIPGLGKLPGILSSSGSISPFTFPWGPAS